MIGAAIDNCGHVCSSLDTSELLRLLSPLAVYPQHGYDIIYACRFHTWPPCEMMPCLFVTLHWFGGTAPHRSVESVHNHPERGKTENLWLNVARWLRNWTERLQVRTQQGMTCVLWPLTKWYFEECFNSFCPYSAVLNHTEIHCMDNKSMKHIY